MALLRPRATFPPTFAIGSISSEEGMEKERKKKK